MKTFIDLYTFLCKDLRKKSFRAWLEDPWVGKDKQESLLRIFAGLGLIAKLDSYHICRGNYNKKNITRQETIRDIFYHPLSNLPLNLKDKGDSSDLTGVSKNNSNHLLLTTSKNIDNMQVGNLHIDKILTNFEQYKQDGYTMSLCVCIRDIEEFQRMKKGIEESNHQLKDLLEKKDTVIIDWSDLAQAYSQFRFCFSRTTLDEIITSSKPTLCLYMHQRLSVKKTLRLKREGEENILWGHVQRSGKSYIVGGCIINDSLNKKECNYLVITTAPKETIDQQRKIFDCIQLKDFTIVEVNGKNKSPKLTKQNIIICSKQFLQTKLDDGEKTNKISWLHKLPIDMRFIDESHNGGTTPLTKKTLDFYGKSSCTVHITATYSKPTQSYGIPRDCWVLWDLEDIRLCKRIRMEGSLSRLGSKHGVEDVKEITGTYSLDNIISTYSSYPELHLLTDELKPDTVSDIVRDTRDNHYGWSIDSCFLLKQGVGVHNGKNRVTTRGEFQNEDENLKLWYRIFGKRNEIGIPDKDYPDDVVFMKRIEKICKDPNICSRFIGEGEYIKEPMIVMAFLPQNGIDKISKAVVQLLYRNRVIPDYEVVCLNSHITSKPKQSIEEARNRARLGGKKGVLVLSGRQCSLGVSIDNCDVVLLLNSTKAFDMVDQMMFRSMTPGTGKKCGFVVDLNLSRVVDTSVSYASLLKPDLHPRDAIQFILQERLLNLNGDHWMAAFGRGPSDIGVLCGRLYDIYSSKAEQALRHFLDRLRLKHVLLAKEDQLLFNTMFITTSPPVKIRKEIVEIITKGEEGVKQGVEKTAITNPDESDEKDKEDGKVDYMDILNHFIPLICLLTIHEEETSFVEMFRLIEKNEYMYNILVDQSKSWWGGSLDSSVLKMFIDIYKKYLKDDKEIVQLIRTVKDLFVRNIDNSKQLSKLIDTYLEATELEKADNAEIPTLSRLRQESLDKIPEGFWETPKKIIEPSCGKGGYIIDIIDRFKEGLKATITDEKQRYRTIVEECIYFSDINPTNIFICKLLIDPYNEYSINYHEGNTLELDTSVTTAHWKGTEKFNLHVCNPPYEDNCGGKRKALNHNLWSCFLKWSYDRLEDGGLLLYITPTSWMSPTSKLKDIFYNNHILYLNVNECKKYFNVGSTFSYYLIKKTTTRGVTEVVCEYNRRVYTSTCDLGGMSYLPKFTTKNTISVINKFMNNSLPKVSFRTSCELHNTTHKNKLNDHKSDTYIFPVRHTTKRNIRYSSCKHSKHHEKKILLNLSGKLTPIYDEGTMGFTQAQMYLLTDEEKYVTTLNSRIYRFVFSVCKWSGFNIEKMFHNIPFLVVKGDEELYRIFNLTEEEISIVEEST